MRVHVHTIPYREDWRVHGRDIGRIVGVAAARSKTPETAEGGRTVRNGCDGSTRKTATDPRERHLPFKTEGKDRPISRRILTLANISCIAPLVPLGLSRFRYRARTRERGRADFRSDNHPRGFPGKLLMVRITRLIDSADKDVNAARPRNSAAGNARRIGNSAMAPERAMLL